LPRGLRQELDLPGLTVAQTVPFRDKERMKQLIDAAGLRTPGHEATETAAGVWAAAERLGFPLIVKPIAGAGEIAARPPGARMVDVMNFATDADLFSAWAQAVTCGRISQPIERRYNTASIFKRAEGAGRISHYQGLDHLLAEYGEQVAAVELLPVGAPRRDWRAASISDGMVIVRHGEAVEDHRDGGTLCLRPPPVRRVSHRTPRPPEAHQSGRHMHRRTRSSHYSGWVRPPSYATVSSGARSRPAFGIGCSSQP